MMTPMNLFFILPFLLIGVYFVFSWGCACGKKAADLPEIVLNERQLCDVELLLNGGSPNTRLRCSFFLIITSIACETFILNIHRVLRSQSQLSLCRVCATVQQFTSFVGTDLLLWMVSWIRKTTKGTKLIIPCTFVRLWYLGRQCWVCANISTLSCRSVVTSMRLSDGTLWPIPITLDISDHWVQCSHVLYS